jgi:hypothetical protein
VLVVVALGAAAFVVLTGGDDTEKVVLEPIDLVQEDDFAGNLDVGDATAAATAAAATLTNTEVPDPRNTEEAGASLASSVVTGTDQAVYGGSRDTQVCDVDNLVAFLTDEANAGKAEAWAGVLGVEVSEIPTYIGGLTAVRLRYDTRVTNHGYRDGEANAFQSLLQAGTAVLVDDTGVPRVKCNCGNPLGEPTVLSESGGEVGTVEDIAENPDTAWDGLDPAQAVSVQPGEQAVESVTLIDLDNGGLLERPVGSDGASKTDVGTGDVQITLEWASDSDLDLHVIEPDGTEIDYTNPGPSSTGGQLDVDSNIECENDGGVENIFWPVGDAPSGAYHINVNGYQLTREDGSDCGGGDFTLTIKVAGDTRTETGSVGQDEDAGYDFSVP